MTSHDESSRQEPELTAQVPAEQPPGKQSQYVQGSPAPDLPLTEAGAAYAKGDPEVVEPAIVPPPEPRTLKERWKSLAPQKQRMYLSGAILGGTAAVALLVGLAMSGPSDLAIDPAAPGASATLVTAGEDPCAIPGAVNCVRGAGPEVIAAPPVVAAIPGAASSGAESYSTQAPAAAIPLTVNATEAQIATYLSSLTPEQINQLDLQQARATLTVQEKVLATGADRQVALAARVAALSPDQVSSPPPPEDPPKTSISMKPRKDYAVHAITAGQVWIYPAGATRPEAAAKSYLEGQSLPDGSTLIAVDYVTNAVYTSKGVIN